MEEEEVRETRTHSPVERREPIHHLISDHPKTPPVHCSSIVLFPEHLRGQVLWCATERRGGLTIFDVLLAESEVSEHNMTCRRGKEWSLHQLSSSYHSWFLRMVCSV